MSPKRSDRERKKGTADLLALSLLDERQRHGYEIAKLIEQRSGGELVFHVASLYTLLKRLERRGVEYQACDNEKCFSPASVPLSWTVAVAALDRQFVNRAR